MCDLTKKGIHLAGLIWLGNMKWKFCVVHVGGTYSTACGYYLAKNNINIELSLSEFRFCLSITIVEGFAFLSLLCNFFGNVLFF